MIISQAAELSYYCDTITGIRQLQESDFIYPDKVHLFRYYHMIIQINFEEKEIAEVTGICRLVTWVRPLL